MSGCFAGPRPRVFGHRGAAGRAPENTIVSFRQAVEDGADILELDVHATRDGHIVVIHDATVDRTTDGSGAVRDFDLATIRTLDAGYRFERASGAGVERASGAGVERASGADVEYAGRGEMEYAGHGAVERAAKTPFRGRGVCIPTLDELLDAAPEAPLNIEIKQSDPPIERKVVDLLRERGALDRVVLAAEKDEIMARIRETARDVRTSLSAAEAVELFGRILSNDLTGYRAPGVALQVPPSYQGADLVTETTLEVAHRLGLEVHVWTINDESEMDRLLDLGVDGIMSDLPGILRAVVDRRARR